MLFDFGMITQNALQSLRHEDKDIHTQIYNRRGFLSVTEYMLENCQRQRTLATLFYFDILHYESLMKEYGALIEKDLLHSFVRILKNTFRKSDLLARISDRRFVVVTTHDSDSDNPKMLLQRMVERTRTHDELADQKFQIKYRVGLITSEPEYLKESGRLLDLVDKRMREQQFSDRHSIVS